MSINRNSPVLKLAVLVFLAAALVRLFFLIYESRHPTKDFSSIMLSGEVARNITEGRGLVFDVARLRILKEIEEEIGHKVDPEDVKALLVNGTYIPEYKKAISYEPGYPLFLSALWRMVGEERYIFPSLVHVFLGGIAALGVFLVARSLFGLPVAVLAGFLYAFYVPEAKMSVVPYQYPWMGFTAVWFVWFLIKAHSLKEKRSFYFMAAMCGAVAALGTLMYSTLVFFPILAVIFFFFVSRFKNAFVASITMFAVFIGLLSPLLYYNISEFGEARIVTRPFWFNVARGLGQSPNPWGFLPDDGVIFNFVAKKHPEYLLYGAGSEYNADVEKYLKSEILRGIGERPLWYVGTALERLTMVILPFHWAITQGEINEDAEGKISLGPRGEAELLGAFIASIWIVIAFVGMWLGRRKWLIVAPLFLVLFYFLGIHTLTVVHPYYLNVLSFVYAIFSAYALKRGSLFVRERIQTLS